MIENAHGRAKIGKAVKEKPLPTNMTKVIWDDYDGQ
jgi:hypothetical protein